MRKYSATLAMFCLLAAFSPRVSAQPDIHASSVPDLKALFRYESTGLSLLHPHTRGKVPVVFVHGLWASPWSWHRMIEALEADPAVKDHFQFWTFGYSTGDPIPFSAHLLRRDLNEVRQKFDPGKTDPAFDRMVIIGHHLADVASEKIVSAGHLCQNHSNVIAEVRRVLSEHAAAL